ncbi:hypothetical protein T552_01335 [Pneumocystis carinii B80]|uniref:Uncharacterized protein n=1 Tax=Pneumocystis carinii (strain B80) TaxID=1408658 RepID=A0A0W4ZLX2_PNEC8|nr:hypothetical protein T552_01335 [Pneumocystis carinii B80]KTW29381.1 hypothetical protein T552_01335 [Pneumocystis carinii B80]
MMGNPEKRQSDIAYENSLNETLELLINDISHGKFDFLSTGFGNCPFLTDCDASKIPYFQIGYNCYTYSIQNISDVFRSCEKLAVFLQVKNFVNYKKDKETREPKIKGSEFCQNLCSDSGKCPLYNKNNKLESLKDLVNKFKGHIMECLDMDKKPHNPLHFNIHKKKSKLLETFFPFSPTINSILATFYVSGPPNFILAFIPHNINKHILSVFVAFAIGGFFGDILLHLLPEVFLDKKTDEDFNIALFDKQKNIVISFFILTGFICFMLIDRTLRLFLEHDSNHGHNKKHTEDSDDKKHDKPVAVSTSISLKSDDTNDIKKRIVVNDEKKEDPPVSSEKNPKPALSGYLNLIADFFHNFTDGLALSTSFYVSPITGMTTTMTIFFHEIPREFGDFAVILHSGFTKYQALSCQFVTATSTFLGAFVGIILNKFSTSFSNIEAHFFNTSILPNNLILSFIIGTFLYVGTVGIVHELLNDKNSGFFVIFFQLFAIFLGFGCMLII